LDVQRDLQAEDPAVEDLDHDPLPYVPLFRQHFTIAVGVGRRGVRSLASSLLTEVKPRAGVAFARRRSAEGMPSDIVERVAEGSLANYCDLYSKPADFGAVSCHHFM